MIRKILTYYAERLDEYLSRTHRQPEGLAMVGLIGNSTEASPNKMVVSLLNVERESAGGTASSMQRTTEGGYLRTQPPLQLNLNPVVAEVYGGKDGLHDRNRKHDHARHEQRVDIAGRTVLPVSGMQNPTADP